MQTKKLRDGFEIPVLGIGTYGMGGEKTADTTHDAESIKAIKDAIKLGYIHIDTAESYGMGHAEELVGKAIAGMDRKKLFVTTKASPTHLHYEDVITSAKNSLARLQTNFIDLYLIHSPNPEIPIAETMKAMDYLVDHNLVRFIGVSNFLAGQLQEAQQHTKHKIVANQLKYNLWAQHIDIEAIQYCQNNNIMVIAFKPFGRGKIATEKIDLLSELSKKYGKTEPQIILNWLTAKKNIVALFKSTIKEHLLKNKDIFDFTLTEEESKKIDDAVHVN